jgi:hypothetical protein
MDPRTLLNAKTPRCEVIPNEQTLVMILPAEEVGITGEGMSDDLMKINSNISNNDTMMQS